MNSLEQLTVVFPCHTLEDLPVRQDEPNARSLMANWTILWHPELIAQAAKLPEWVSSDFVTTEFENALVLVPLACTDNIPIEIEDAVSAGKAEVISGLMSRAELLQHESLEKWINDRVAGDIANDFYALGFAFLQIQLMTRQLRYSSSIDVTRLSESAVAAAESAIDGDESQARKQLQNAFDLIAQERSSYYPTDPTILELVLFAPSTIDQRVHRQLMADQPTNWLMPQSLLVQLEEEQAASYATLMEQVRAGKITIVGGNELRVASQSDVLGISCKSAPDRAWPTIGSGNLCQHFCQSNSSSRNPLAPGTYQPGIPFLDSRCIFGRRYSSTLRSGDELARKRRD